MIALLNNLANTANNLEDDELDDDLSETTNVDFDMMQTMLDGLRRNAEELKKQRRYLVKYVEKPRLLLKEEQKYFTVTAFCNLNDVRLEIGQTFQRLGIVAKRLSAEQNYEVKQVSHDIYGTVNVYHKEILEQLF